MNEKYIRATVAAVIAGLGALTATGGQQPQTTWDTVLLSAGVVTAALTAFVAFLSRFSGQQPS